MQLIYRPDMMHGLSEMNRVSIDFAAGNTYAKKS